MIKISSCILCNINLNKPFEKIYYADDKIVILDTKEKKGHAIRLMVMSRKHTKRFINFKYVENSIDKISEILGLYYPDYDFIHWLGKNRKVKEHWHQVFSCVCKDGKDKKLESLEPTRTLLLLNSPFKFTLRLSKS